MFLFQHKPQEAQFLVLSNCSGQIIPCLLFAKCSEFADNFSIEFENLIENLSQFRLRKIAISFPISEKGVLAV